MREIVEVVEELIAFLSIPIIIEIQQLINKSLKVIINLLGVLKIDIDINNNLKMKMIMI